MPLTPNESPADTIRHWNSERCGRDESLFTRLLRFDGLTPDQVARVLNALDETCPACRNNYRPCHCANDE